MDAKECKSHRSVSRNGVMKRITLTIFVCCIFATMHGQTFEGQRDLIDSISSLFYKQLALFPQEKIYVHTDKPYYISGEKIWFRAFLSDAVTHIPTTASRYIYVELINPMDSVVVRVKIRPQEAAFYGQLPIPDDVPQGDYTLRAYTTFMRSQNEEYFFTKALHIGDPQAGFIQTDTQFFFETERRVHATFRFSDLPTSASLVPHSVTVSVNEGKPMNLKVNSDGTSTMTFSMPATSSKRILLLEIKVSSISYRQFIHVPAPDNDFDIGFYPEGGSLMLGVPCRVVFKATKSNGQSTHIRGTVYDEIGPIAEIKTEHLGMGNFLLQTQEGKSYYAVCENSMGHSKRFDLPVALNHGYALSVHQSTDYLFVRVAEPAGVGQDGKLYLMAHTRGTIHLVEHWDREKKVMMIPKGLFPSGVLHFILFDMGLNPVSERLCFINNQDEAQTKYEMDQADYLKRTLVNNKVTISGSDGQPLTGTFSVSVTSDREVTQDTTSNILTQLLLTSDLRGYIENPVYYFQNTHTSEYALDLLMCTQGWRRYNPKAWAQGRFSLPASPLELGPEVSGTVKSVLLGLPVEGMEVTAASLRVAGGYFHSVKTDKEGRFYLPLREFPDSTGFIVSTEPKKGMTRIDLLLDAESFPSRTNSAIPAVEVNKGQFAQYVDMAERQYIDEGGLRVVQLSPAVVTADRLPPKKSVLYHLPSSVNIVTREKLELAVDRIGIYNLLSQIPGVQLQVDEYGRSMITLRGQGSFGASQPLWLVDDVVFDSNPQIGDPLSLIDVSNIAQIDVLKGPEVAAFGMRGSHGVIAIHTKKGDDISHTATQPFHIKTFLPLGYQPPVEFYAPKYENDAKRYNGKPDLRTTIHWQPVVQTDSTGVASFDFYTADEPISYTITIEGLANDGTIIRKEVKLWPALP